jgi:glycosyltransferase involved in cell wall biosynthesis
MIISVLMPALNEQESVVKTIESIPVKILERNGYRTEIIIIDGGSTDHTAELARSAGAKVIVAEKGYGRQYKEGFKVAAGEIICTADSDCSYPMEEIPRLINILLNEGLDFISTNRFASMDHDSMASVNWFGNRFLTFVTNLLFWPTLKDSQSGMWVFRKNILDELKLWGNGMSLSQEIKIRAFHKYNAREVDSTYRKRIGKVKLRIFIDGVGNLFGLLRLRFDL